MSSINTNLGCRVEETHSARKGMLVYLQTKINAGLIKSEV